MSTIDRIESQISELNMKNNDGVIAVNETKKILSESRLEDGDEKWGLPLKDLYRYGLKFYKGK